MESLTLSTELDDKESGFFQTKRINNDTEAVAEKHLFISKWALKGIHEQNCFHIYFHIFSKQKDKKTSTIFLFDKKLLCTFI